MTTTPPPAPATRPRCPSCTGPLAWLCVVCGTSSEGGPPEDENEPQAQPAPDTRPRCGGKPCQPRTVQAPCPDNRPGCAVYHSRVCPGCPDCQPAPTPSLDTCWCGHVYADHVPNVCKSCPPPVVAGSRMCVHEPQTSEERIDSLAAPTPSGDDARPASTDGPTTGGAR